MEQVSHDFPPVYNGASRILILGTMPSPKSREQGFYYGHPQNRFWPVLANLFHIETPPTVEGKQRLLLEKGIALWDVLSSCAINGADDSSIREVSYHDLDPILETADIRAIFTNGKKAAALYKQSGRTIEKPFFVLPSTSPANCRLSLADLVTAYSVILPYLK